MRRVASVEDTSGIPECFIARRVPAPNAAWLFKARARGNKKAAGSLTMRRPWSFC
jgi:hypothetical protein